MQLLDLPGLVEGAREGVGGGRILLASIRAADAVVYCLPAEAHGFVEGLQVIDEVKSAGIDLPTAFLLTKADLSSTIDGSSDSRLPGSTGLPANSHGRQ